MKKSYFLIIAAALVIGCGKKDKFLFSQVSSEYLINPDTKAIVKDNTILNASLDSSGVIRGVTDKNAFTTSNQFQSFDHAGYSLSATITPYVFDKNTIVVATGTALAPQIHYSLDYGFTWDSIAPVLTPAISTSGYYETDLVSVAFINNQNLVMVYLQKATTSIHAKQIYKVNIATKQGTLINSWQDVYVPVSVKYTNDTTAYMLMYRSSVNGTYICKTTNGGGKWTTPLNIDTKNMSIMQVGNKGNICVYEPNSYAFYSSDSGSHWKKSAYSINFNALHMVTPSLSFALTNNGLVKSVDTGTTWNAVTASSAYEFSSMKHVYFNDDKNGLMYADQKMFITSDGGTTWKTLLYPYDYIIQ